MTVDAKGKVPRVMRSLLFFFLCLAVLLGAEITASLVQRDFGRVDVENVRYPNFNGITIRAKLLKPSGASPLSPLPGAVYIHGYQNNRETGDAYCLELARRGFVVLNIDAIGRGNSGIPNDPKAPDFDPTYGGRTSLEYLRSLPFVRFFHLNGLLSWLYLPLIFILFGFAYGLEHLLEWIFIVDFRFIFPFASDLTPYRALVALRYLPFVVTGFLFLGYFLHGIMRREPRTTPLRTFFWWSAVNLFIVIFPLILFLAIQYVPLFATGFIPFVGPGGMFVSFVINIFHVIGVLFLVIPLSTWFFQMTGRIYLGSVLSALLVTWMFLSSQVIAPIPV
ncbi:MAG: hypothetical protein JRJ35_11195 [Deltaproteobacteria bacterium]|nr:hypothetical protein [Deltaproteobacteria bacterium]